MSVPWDPRLSSWLDEVEAVWEGMGLSPLTCGELRARLVEDLVSALQAGAPVEELVATAPDTFATDVARAAGYDALTAVSAVAAPSSGVSRVRTPLAALSDRLQFVLAALTGAVAGAAVGWYTVLPVGDVVLNAAFPTAMGAGMALSALAFWTLYACFVAVAAGLAVHLQFWNSSLRRRLSRSATVALLVSGAAITLPTVAFAWTTDFSTMPDVVMTEATIVVVALIMGLIVAGEITWGREAPGRLSRRPPRSPA